MKRRNFPERAGRQRGVSLIEVLVGMLVLSVGLLGQALFMMQAMKSVQQSRHRAVAGHFADALFGIALADPGNRARYEVSNGQCTTGWSHCEQWLARITHDLAQREGAPVSAHLEADGRMTVSIRWRDRSGEEQVHTAISHMDLVGQ